MARFFPLIAATLALFSSLVLASPATELYALGQHTNGQYAVIDLNDDFETKSTSADSHVLDKRVNVRWCIESAARRALARLSTIATSIADYLREVDDNVCGVHCIRLDHAGNWNGYVTLGPAHQDLDHLYCGPKYPFGKCGGRQK
ncbi:hypothetical protein FA10DRAFT_261453 [Acaromyces ingoldii]|uniref:Secreted protein CSS2 C-terminal domain-containing protein n=1 Tax=Acaromyces ingoldii TaxID=215250 RepID=A0A316YLK4_9BASI|nr:hypothetical protein FA10DRAFT_261453 [Acaromyces ingoldii]PWN89684.1 hypothetical protein FA10DRAFT_261453 [Acaromyces ingoldii]